MLRIIHIFALQIFLGEEFNRYQAKREIKIQKVIIIISIISSSFIKFCSVENCIKITAAQHSSIISFAFSDIRRPGYHDN